MAKHRYKLLDDSIAIDAAKIGLDELKKESLELIQQDRKEVVNNILKIAKETYSDMIIQHKKTRNYTKLDWGAYQTIVSRLADAYRGTTINYRTYIRTENGEVHIQSFEGEVAESFYQKIGKGKKGRLVLSSDKILTSNNTKKEVGIEELFERHKKHIMSGLHKVDTNNTSNIDSPTSDLNSGLYVARYWVIKKFNDHWEDARFYSRKRKNKLNLLRTVYNTGWLYQFFDATIQKLYPKIWEDGSAVSTSFVSGNAFQGKFFSKEIFATDNISGYRSGDVNDDSLMIQKQIKGDGASVVNWNSITRILKAIIIAAEMEKNTAPSENQKLIKVLDNLFTTKNAELITQNQINKAISDLIYLEIFDEKVWL